MPNSLQQQTPILSPDDAYSYRYDSPAGRMLVHLSPGGSVSRLVFAETPCPALPAGHPVREALDDYFRSGGGLETLDVAIEGSAFRRKVLGAVRTIPPGQVRSYGWVATRIGAPSAARAVGGALASNPVLLALPCHRVVGRRTLGGYAAGAERKRFLLELEKQAQQA